MAKRFKLREMEQQRDKPLSVLIPELLKKHNGKQSAVATELGVSQACVSQWLSANGYRQVVSWERVEVAS